MAAANADGTVFLGHNNRGLRANTVTAGLLNSWQKRWNLAGNSNMSTASTFSFRPGHCPFVSLGDATMPEEATPNYLGITVDRSLTCKPFENKELRTAHLLHDKATIHEILGFPWVSEEVMKSSEQYAKRLHRHPNVMAISLLDNSEHELVQC
ncbi:GD17339 [Drosophila simulans]|uniref:GD17339 n=1 Tax=Drosophila simulans TaxID=7240 RepID=B4R6E9_DROSI|nr:GD17339 [Drosophila simulans]